ncbi:MAG: hypothetical protein AAB257_07545, partial [Nitrospinota bacterium]
MKVLKKFYLWVAVLIGLLAADSLAFAQEDRVRELEKKVDVLVEEIEKMKLGAVAEPKYESFMGLGPAASKVYGVEKGLSIGGYGEVFYNNYQHSSKKDFADAARFILYGGYKFNDWIIMNTELEFEHAGIGNSGTTTVKDSANATHSTSAKEPEVYTEFSYLDFLLSKGFNIRTG